MPGGYQTRRARQVHDSMTLSSLDVPVCAESELSTLGIEIQRRVVADGPVVYSHKARAFSMGLGKDHLPAARAKMIGRAIERWCAGYWQEDADKYGASASKLGDLLRLSVMYDDAPEPHQWLLVYRLCMHYLEFTGRVCDIMLCQQLIPYEGKLVYVKRLNGEEDIFTVGITAGPVREHFERKLSRRNAYVESPADARYLKVLEFPVPE